MTKITGFTQKTALDGAADWLVCVDVSDTSMDASGTNGRISSADLFGGSTALAHDAIFGSGNGVRVGGGSSTLAHYVESTSFTPTVIGTTSGAGTYSVQSGRYTRIGNICFFELRLDFTKNTISGGVRIGGFPFTVRNSSPRAGMQIGEVSRITFTDMLTIESIPNTTEFRLMDNTTGAAAATITDSDLDASQTMVIIAAGQYFID